MIKKGEKQETGRTFLGCQIQVDSELIKQGWEWRCNVDRSKLTQLVDLYEELGFEVCLEPVKIDCLSIQCKGCAGGLTESRAVFVRPRN